MLCVVMKGYLDLVLALVPAQSTYSLFFIVLYPSYPSLYFFFFFFFFFYFFLPAGAACVIALYIYIGLLGVDL